MRAEIFRFGERGGVVKDGTISLDEHGVAQADSDGLRFWMETTVVVAPGDPPRPVTPEDGERYIRALPYTLRGIGGRAVVVE